MGSCGASPQLLIHANFISFQAVIRVQFPDSWVLQGVFESSETCKLQEGYWSDCVATLT